MPDIKIVSSEIEVTLKVIGGKWKPLILHYLQYGGVKRYNEILRYLEPPRPLAAQPERRVRRMELLTGQSFPRFLSRLNIP